MTDWNRIVREHGRMVFGTAWRILGHAADAEDVVQEVFLEAHRLRQSQPVANWAGLLRKMTAFRAVDCLRQRKPVESLNGKSLAGLGHGPEALAMERELAGRLRKALNHLTQQEATVFCLRYFEELSYQDIAESLAISTGAVAAALHKARARLTVLLSEEPKEICHEPTTPGPTRSGSAG